MKIRLKLSRAQYNPGFSGACCIFGFLILCFQQQLCIVKGFQSCSQSFPLTDTQFVGRKHPITSSISTSESIATANHDVLKEHPLNDAPVTTMATTIAGPAIIMDERTTAQEEKGPMETISPKQQRKKTTANLTLHQSTQNKSIINNNKNNRLGWMERARQLYQFQRLHGHVLVPKRYAANPPLGNWVNKMRQEYRRYKTGQTPCALTERRIAILNQMNFAWEYSSSCVQPHQKNASETAQVVSSRGSKMCTRSDARQQEQQESEREWWSRWNELKVYVTEQQQISNGSSSSHASTKLAFIPRQTRLGLWLDRQRGLHRMHDNDGTRTNKNTTTAATLSDDRVAALASLDPDWWMTRRQWQWEQRYRELQAYAAAHGGDCRVPITYAANQPLAHWVSTQRKQYNRKMAGKSSDLTEYRYQRLEAMGFVWSARCSWNKMGDTADC